MLFAAMADTQHPALSRPEEAQNHPQQLTTFAAEHECLIDKSHT